MPLKNHKISFNLRLEISRLQSGKGILKAVCVGIASKL